MKKILYIKRGNTAFYEIDQQILGKKYLVIPFLFPANTGKWIFIMDLIRMVRFILVNSRKADAMVTWFADYHAALMVFLGKLLGIKVIIFAGGQEAICYPELRKGVYYKKVRAVFVRYALKHASHIVPNHKSLIFHENLYYSATGKKDGIRYYIPEIRTPMSIVPNGIDTVRFFRDPSIPKEVTRILTVGTMDSQFDFLNKGFDLFIEAARLMPALKFTLIGIKPKFRTWAEDRYNISALTNLELIYSYCPHEVLFSNYNRAKIFVQASITEGMPNTLSEAMLCECIPVGSNVNGIPDAIGNTGIIVNKRSPEELVKAIGLAMKINNGEEARRQVLNNYTVDIRSKNLYRLFDTLLSG